MRKLTIKRKESYIEALSMLNIYIEDPVAGDRIINGTRCKYLGAWGNGDIRAFMIGDRETKVFAIEENKRQDVCDEYYDLPAGTENVILSGQNCIDVDEGTGFRFDNNRSKASQEKRKKENKRKRFVFFMATSAMTINILIICFIAFVFLRFSGEVEKMKFFSNGEISIALPERFKEMEAPTHLNWQGMFLSDDDDVEVLLRRKGFTEGSSLSKYSESQYAGLYITTNDLDAKVQTKSGSLTCFTYRYPNAGDHERTYICYVYKTDGAFWIVQYGVRTREFAEYEKEVESWARQVRVLKSEELVKVLHKDKENIL